jgi:hypothetical protein
MQSGGQKAQFLNFKSHGEIQQLRSKFEQLILRCLPILLRTLESKCSLQRFEPRMLYVCWYSLQFVLGASASGPHD